MSLKQTRNKRIDLIKAIEKITASKLVVYFTADSPIVGAVISEDALLPIYKHLLAIGKQKRIALYLYSPGGQMETPWKIVNMLREFCEEFHVVIPYKAYSGATMICLGSDKILMSRKAELGPIDPALQIAPNQAGAGLKLPELGVEDVSAYVKFIKDRVGLVDQAAVASLMSLLASNLTPPVLGRLERVYQHIRLVGHNLLMLHKPQLQEEKIKLITEALTEKMYVHGHGIARREATDLGLDVQALTDDEEKPIWELYSQYEEAFRLRDTREAEFYFPQDSDIYERPDTSIGCIESQAHLHEFAGKLRAQRLRNVPPNPTINVSLNLQAPPGIAQANPQQLQALLNQMLQQAAQQLNQLVSKEIQRQSPVTGIVGNLVGGVWREVN